MDATGRPGSTIGRLGRRTTVLLAVVALVAACSNAGGGTTAPPATQAAGPSAAATMAASEPAAAGVELELAEDAELGGVRDGRGRDVPVRLPARRGRHERVQRRVRDQLAAADRRPSSAGDGVTGELGTITRDDGTTQVTLGGAPLYYFIGDEAAGDVKGQGQNDVWFLASPEGAAVGGEDGPPGEETPCDGRYCY